MRVPGVLLGLALLLPAGPLAAEESVDVAAIRRPVLDYAEGWYEGNPDKMERALHPDLAKRVVGVDAKGHSRLENMGALTLIQAVRAGYGKSTPLDKQQKDVTVLDAFGNAATVKLVMSGWIDYLHVAKLEGRWQIVNVLWERKPEPPK